MSKLAKRSLSLDTLSLYAHVPTSVVRPPANCIHRHAGASCVPRAVWPSRLMPLYCLRRRKAHAGDSD